MQLSATEARLADLVDRLATSIVGEENIRLQPGEEWEVDLTQTPPLLTYRVADAAVLGDQTLSVTAHEIAHLLHTEPVNYDILPWDRRGQNGLAQLLIFAVEDRRIERMFSESFPGARSLFDEKNSQQWTAKAVRGFPGLPAKWRFLLNASRVLNGQEPLGSELDKAYIARCEESLQLASLGETTQDLADSLGPAFTELLAMVTDEQKAKEEAERKAAEERAQKAAEREEQRQREEAAARAEAAAQSEKKESFDAAREAGDAIKEQMDAISEETGKPNEIKGNAEGDERTSEAGQGAGGSEAGPEDVSAPDGTADGEDVQGDRSGDEAHDQDLRSGGDNDLSGESSDSADKGGVDSHGDVASDHDADSTEEAPKGGESAQEGTEYVESDTNSRVAPDGGHALDSTRDEVITVTGQGEKLDASDDDTGENQSESTKSAGGQSGTGSDSPDDRDSTDSSGLGSGSTTGDAGNDGDSATDSDGVGDGDTVGGDSDDRAGAENSAWDDDEYDPEGDDEGSDFEDDDADADSFDTDINDEAGYEDPEDDDLLDRALGEDTDDPGVRPTSLLDEMINDLAEDDDHKKNPFVVERRRKMEQQAKEARAVEREIKKEIKESLEDMAGDIGVSPTRASIQKIRANLQRLDEVYEFASAQVKPEILALRRYAMQVLQENQMDRFGGNFDRGKRIKTSRLYRVMTGDPRLFERRIQISGKSYAIGLCVDQSSSMGGSRQGSDQILAFQSAVIMAEAFEDLIDTAIVGFSDNFPKDIASPRSARSLRDRSEKQARLYKGVDDKLQHRRSIMSAMRYSFGCTPLGAGMQATFQEVVKSEAEVRAIIAITDGAPTDGNRFDHGGDNWSPTASVVTAARQQHIECYSLNIGREIERTNKYDYYGNIIRGPRDIFDHVEFVEDATEVPMSVVAILRQVIRRNVGVAM